LKDFASIKSKLEPAAVQEDISLKDGVIDDRTGQVCITNDVST
jgi:hypothetical protein